MAATAMINHHYQATAPQPPSSSATATMGHGAAEFRQLDWTEVYIQAYSDPYPLFGYASPASGQVQHHSTQVDAAGSLGGFGLADHHFLSHFASTTGPSLQPDAFSQQHALPAPIPPPQGSPASNSQGQGWDASSTHIQGAGDANAGSATVDAADAVFFTISVS